MNLFQSFTVLLFAWRGRVLIWKFMAMFKINMDARKSRSFILQYRPYGIPLTVKLYTVHQIIMTLVFPFVRLLVKEVSTRICFTHTLKIQIKYCPHLTTGLYENSMLREWILWNNTLSSIKVLKLSLTWSCCGAKSAWNIWMPPSYLWQRIFCYLLALAVQILRNPTSFIWWRGKDFNSTTTHAKTTMSWFIKWLTTFRCATVLISDYWVFGWVILRDILISRKWKTITL